MQGCFQHSCNMVIISTQAEILALGGPSNYAIYPAVSGKSLRSRQCTFQQEESFSHFEVIKIECQAQIMT